MFLVRKISRSKWPTGEQVSVEQFRADAITVDLRTHEDTLSLWKCESDGNQYVDEVALALAIAPERNDIGRVQVVLLIDSELLTDGLISVDTPGNTRIEQLKHLHTNLKPLTYWQLGQVAEKVDRAIRNGQFKQYSESRIKNLIQAAVDQGRIQIESLPDKIQTKLAKP